MNTTLTRRPVPSIYSAILLAFIAIAYALQVIFIAGLAGGNQISAASAPAIMDQGARPVPCVDG